MPVDQAHEEVATHSSYTSIEADDLESPTTHLQQGQLRHDEGGATPSVLADEKESECERLRNELKMSLTRLSEANRRHEKAAYDATVLREKLMKTQLDAIHSLDTVLVERYSDLTGAFGKRRTVASQELSQPLAAAFAQRVSSRRPVSFAQEILDVLRQDPSKLSRENGVYILDNLSVLDVLRVESLEGHMNDALREKLRETSRENKELSDEHKQLRRHILGRLFYDALLDRNNKWSYDLIVTIHPMLDFTVHMADILETRDQVAADIEHRFPSWANIIDKSRTYVEKSTAMIKICQQGYGIYQPTAPLSSLGLEETKYAKEKTSKSSMRKKRSFVDLVFGSNA